MITNTTLGQLLGSDDITIKRNAMSILKVMQNCDHKHENGKCIYCFQANSRPHSEALNHEGIKCPLCENFCPHEIRDGVHTWPCGECPFIGQEIY